VINRRTNTGAVVARPDPAVEVGQLLQPCSTEPTTIITNPAITPQVPAPAICFILLLRGRKESLLNTDSVGLDACALHAHAQSVRG